MKRFLTALLCTCLCCTTALAAPNVSAQKAIVMDAATGQVFYAKNVQERALIASTTKILTALVVCESCGLDEIVTIPAEAVGVEGSSLYLQQGEQLTVEQLLYGLMLRSGNDAAVALAVYCAGSVEEFAALMNEKATELGLRDSHFVNPHGLDAEEHYSTAADLAKIAAAAMENETLRAITATKSISFGQRSLQNHNKLLWQYEGCVGVKTGFTKAAGRILVSCAERGGRRLICVTIHAPDDWRDHRALLDDAFSHYEERPLTPRTARVQLMDGSWAELTAEEEQSVLLLPGEEPELELCAPRFAWSAEELEDAVMLVKLSGREIARIPLRAVEKP